MAKDFIQNMDLKKGALRAELNTPKGKDIPVSKLEKAKASNNPTLERRANLALEFRGMNKGKKDSDGDYDNGQ